MDPIRFSHLKQMARSPAHYMGAVVEKTSSIEKGTATHALVLGGRRVIAYPGKVRNGKEWDAFEAANPDAEILTKNDFAKAQAMADSVLRNREAMRVLEGVREHRINWSLLGRQCRSTPDNIGDEFVTELKTGVTSDPARFQWQALRMHYNAQLAFYDEAVRWAELTEPKAHYIVAVESAAPFVVTVFRLTERALEMGRRNFRLWFERVLACEEANAWPGYCEAVVDLDSPDDDTELVFADDAATEAA